MDTHRRESHISRVGGNRQYLALAMIALLGCCVFVFTMANERQIRVVPRGHHPIEFWPLWQDHYKPLAEYPPWPQGPTAQQQAILLGFDRIWIASLDPEPLPIDDVQRLTSFHGYRVSAFFEVGSIRERLRLRDGFKACIGRREPGWPSEGYPGLGLRLQSGERFVDLVTERRHRLLFIYDEESLTYLRFPSGSELGNVLQRFAGWLPVDAHAD